MTDPSDFDRRMDAYEAELRKLQFQIDDQVFVIGEWADVGASYVKANAQDERIWVACRPLKGAKMQIVSLNPAAAFALANAILEQGTRAGWFGVASVDGETAPKSRH